MGSRGRGSQVAGLSCLASHWLSLYGLGLKGMQFASGRSALFRIRQVRCYIGGFGVRVLGLGVLVHVLGFRDWGLGARAWCLVFVFSVQGSGFRVL